MLSGITLFVKIEIFAILVLVDSNKTCVRATQNKQALTSQRGPR